MGGEVMQRGYTLEELWAAARRRLKAGLAVFGAALVLGALVVAALPDEYRAQTTIILEPYRPHVELVTPAVTTLLEDRLRVARQQLLSRPALERVVQELDLYPDSRAKGGLDAAVDRLRSHLEVHPDGDSAIVVAFRTSSKEQAAKVVQAVADGFVRANADMRTGQAERVLGILTDELKNVQGQLDLNEAKVRDFRRAHDGELPEQVETNLREAERATRLLDTATAYARDLERRRALIPSNPTSPEVERIATMESDLVRQLNHAQAIFSEDHPEPQRLARELEGLRELKTQAAGRADGFQREKEGIAREMERNRQEISSLESKIREAKERASAGARWGSELVVLERDRDLLREKYRSLLSRKVESEVALNLERKAAPLATRVVDPAIDPALPAAPDRLRLLLVVLVLAAGLGVGAGVLLETRDSTVRTPAQARAQLGVPLLAVLPPLKSGKAA